MPLREQDLAAPVAGHFESLDYRVFSEVEIAGRWADLVGIGPDFVAVELKLRAWRGGAPQEAAGPPAAGRADVALPPPGAQGGPRARGALERGGSGGRGRRGGMGVRSGGDGCLSPPPPGGGGFV